MHRFVVGLPRSRPSRRRKCRCARRPARATIGGPSRARRTSASAVAFQSLTTLAPAGVDKAAAAMATSVATAMLLNGMDPFNQAASGKLAQHAGQELRRRPPRDCVELDCARPPAAALSHALPSPANGQQQKSGATRTRHPMARPRTLREQMYAAWPDEGAGSAQSACRRRAGSSKTLHCQRVAGPGPVTAETTMP